MRPASAACRWWVDHASSGVVVRSLLGSKYGGDGRWSGSVLGASGCSIGIGRDYICSGGKG